MKHNSVIKALQKQNIKIENDKDKYWATNEINEISWFNQSDEAICLYVKPRKYEDDITTDYYCGTFHDTIKIAIRDFLNQDWLTGKARSV